MELLDRDLAAEKLMCYRGIARVPLHSLRFGHRILLDKHRELSYENVIRLERIYEQVGCLRLQEENIINAVIEDDDLVAALSLRDISLDDMRILQWPQDAPSLQPKNVQCLSGMHRIEAARRFLNENDKWWIVRLFSSDTPKPLLVRIIESYSNEQKPSDGEIFRKIRLYHRENDQEAQKRWWSRLEKSKPKDLRQLFRRPTLTVGFDALIDMPGLWPKLQLGALHRLLVLKCDEEMALYLDHVAKSWKRILQCGDTMLPFSAVDAFTVQSLELLAPKHSDIDKSLAIDLMECGKIFPSQNDRGIRKTLMENICNFPGVIPSLRTFFETLKYLEPLCEALKWLLGTQMKHTIRSSLIGLFFPPGKNMVQLNETEDSADFGLPTATHVLVQDGMDIDIPPELSNLDAQHAELQLRYATLQQEYQKLSNQHEKLVSKSDTQYETVHHLEVQNAEMKGLLEKYPTEYQELKNAYYRVMQEHETCQKVKEQLQDLAHRWKAQSEENKELTSLCAKLRRELKALENWRPENPLLRVEEVQTPVAVEATTMSHMESSDDEPISDDLMPYTWTAGSDDPNQYEIFLSYAVTKECKLQGYGFNISQSIDEAMPQIVDSLRQAEIAFGSDQFHAITVLGIYLTNTEPAYLFELMKSICLLCGRSFRNPDALQQHERDSPGHTKSFNCKDCNRSFGSEEALAQHLTHSPAPSNEGHGSSNTGLPKAPTADHSEYFGQDSVVSFHGNLDDTDFLISNDSEDDDTGDSRTNEWTTQIRHAPLVSADVIFRDTQHVLPQYGLMGLHDEAKDTRSKLFLNTNIPFSIFLCGVQGSGKSHTTSCILENSLVSSKHLGKLENPLSALVFSYGHFNGDGVGFSISEAAFLASPEAGVPGAANVKKVHVLVSPSNYVRISKLYLRLPNVSVTPFRIKPQNLDINTMLTLMNVNESEETPLYMAQVTQILREMSTAGGPFHYETFKLHLKKQKFSPTQTNMLRMRLNLLESFLDMKNTFSETQFLPGEIVIMDMSCPFVDANTACVLFEIGLQQYLQSKSTGKIIVLDEAHKYMLKIPGAKSLNETLLQTIRLQRHHGARVIVSTQEPTLLTDLIALCSVTVIHRFSSPEWFSAIRRHIPIMDENHDDLMRRIESLKTGRAIIYSPSAVLGLDEYNRLIMGTSRMIDVRVRRRLTSDGGQSVLAV
ncbi:ATPase [Pyrenophora tritici-repentis]|nr:ATPase [Pyrenophora tritici-repentis]